MDPRRGYAFMKAYRAIFPLAAMCRVLGLSPSGYYDWLQRPPSARARRDAELKGRILAKWIESEKIYGCPRIHAALRDEGERVSRKRVARLMREMGIEGVTRRRFRTGTTKRDAQARPAPDLVARDFSAEGPDQLWVADITQVRTWAGWLYLAVVLDAWSRRIVGWAMAPRMPADLVGDALTMAISSRQPEGPVIHHSDQGSQYTSLAFGKRCREAGVVQSMGSVGDAYDNAMCE
ncbi:MAG: IS3 family transposase, partial [Gemmatimonadota bacterium]|nr:IS3 family transposase [Gemmatimonadota bacterium]